MPAIKLEPKSTDKGAKSSKAGQERNEELRSEIYNTTDEDGCSVQFCKFVDLNKPYLGEMIRTQREGKRPMQLGPTNLKTWEATIKAMHKVGLKF